MERSVHKPSKNGQASRRGCPIRIACDESVLRALHGKPKKGNAGDGRRVSPRFPRGLVFEGSPGRRLLMRAEYIRQKPEADKISIKRALERDEALAIPGVRLT